MAVVDERTKKGPFESLFDFTTRVDLRTCNRKTIESLIQAGAFDSMHRNRHELIENLDDALNYGQKKQQEAMLNQASLFGAPGSGTELAPPKLKPFEMWSTMERLKTERELIGFYLSEHPLDKYKTDIELFCSHNLSAASQEKMDGGLKAKCAGIITAVKQVYDKKGRPVAFLSIEDEHGSIELIAFSNVYDKFKNLMEVDNIVVVDGKADSRSGQPKILADSFDRIENLREKNQNKIRLTLKMNTAELTNESLKLVAGLFEKNRGNTSIALEITSAESTEPLKMTARKFVIDPTEEFMRELRSLVGSENARLERVA